ncbi:MAG: hypothetical protein IJP89_04765 [Synergistaceae bacterium]|nr:hypothetical protein [Synergistaceae bacterium]MBR0150655.1 hypothetical protein [Synergistaceae bacterium]MBR0256339.1 hypothetical protein [Synergistaceae bacterium]
MTDFVLDFRFDREEEENLDYINRALSGLPLSKVYFRDLSVRLDVSLPRADYSNYEEAVRNNPPSYSYKLGDVYLDCTSSSNEESYFFQIDASIRKLADASKMRDEWQEEHPGLQPADCMRIDFGDNLYAKDICVFVVLYRKKTNGDD